VPLLDRLRARLGDDAVVLIAPRADHRPELAEKRVRLDFCHLSAPEGRRVGQIESDALSPTLPPRPLWLLNEPLPLSALLEAAPWVLKDGPERIESGWWDGRDFRRDYFVAESPAGELAWIYRDHRYGLEAGEWFLHGWWA